jgi:hypothetical protein
MPALKVTFKSGKSKLVDLPVSTGKRIEQKTSGLPWFNIPYNERVEVPANRQSLIQGDRTVSGELTVKGEAVNI